MTADADNNAVEKFRQYLRIDTTTRHADYASVVAFLKDYAAELGCNFQAVECVANKPVCILTFGGSSLAHETIMLNSHSDVVPADAQCWSHPPFAAEMDAAGNIYARGSHDTKQIGIQYLEALRRLKEENVPLKRTIAVTYVPDEEIGGMDGMFKFVESDAFRSMNVQFCLDEGLPSPGRFISFFDIEKYKMPFRFIIQGVAGHPSLMPSNTAAEKLARLLEEIYNFREQERAKIGSSVQGKHFTINDVVSTNLTVVSGGVGENVIPNRIECLLDCRVPPQVLPNEMHKRMAEIVQRAAKRAGCDAEAGGDLLAGCGGITLISTRAAEFAPLDPQLMQTELPQNSKYRTLLNNASNQFGLAAKWEMFPAQTDARFLRRKGIPVVNISPMFNLQVLAHEVDEHLHRDMFLEGVKFYYYAIQQLANAE